MNMRTILIVDDEMKSRELLSRVLVGSGWDVITANNGRDALEKIKVCRPHIIVLDMTMPEMDGFEVARSLKSNPEYRTIPILAATGLCSWGDRQRCLAAGCDDYVAKPFTVQQLQQHLVSLLQIH
jgi:two-component system cell cycle response regulator DivK